MYKYGNATDLFIIMQIYDDNYYAIAVRNRDDKRDGGGEIILELSSFGFITTTSPENKIKSILTRVFNCPGIS